MSNIIAPGSSADVNVRVTALTTNTNVPVTYKTIILKKNLVDGVNTLTQAMMNQPNTKYVIKYDYTLDENITVPANCVLEFDGGSISGDGTDKDTIICNNTKIISCQGVIFNAVLFSGTFSCNFRVSWLNLSDDNTYNTKILVELSKIYEKNFCRIIWDVKNINLELYSGFDGIRLQDGVNDFNNTCFTVTNKINGALVLFIKVNDFTEIAKPESYWGAYNNAVFKDTEGLLLCHDDNVFIQRQGGQFTADREDIILVKNNVPQWDPILGYATESSTFSYYIPDHRIICKNVKIKRSSDSTNITFAIKVVGELSPILENIIITVDDVKGMSPDTAILIYKTFNPILRNIDIQNTYSATSSFGYGLQFGTTSNSILDNVKFQGKWLTVSGNNTNGVHSKDCTFFGFDCHCYSKDFFFDNCILYDGTFVSYHKGYIKYINCELNNAWACKAPYSDAAGEYPVHTYFKLILEGCKIINSLSSPNYGILSAYNTLSTQLRSDIETNKIPDVSIRDCIFYSSVSEFYQEDSTWKPTVINVGQGTQVSDNRQKVTIENCKFESNSRSFLFHNSSDVYINGLYCKEYTQPANYVTMSNISFEENDDSSTLIVIDSKINLGRANYINVSQTYINTELRNSYVLYSDSLYKNVTFENCIFYNDINNGSYNFTVPIANGTFKKCKFATLLGRTGDRLAIGGNERKYIECSFDSGYDPYGYWRYEWFDCGTFKYVNNILIVENLALKSASYESYLLNLNSNFSYIDSTGVIKYVKGGALVTRGQFFSD